MSNRKSLLIGSLIFLICGIGLIFFWKKTMNEFKSSKNWSTAKAIILVSEVKTKIDYDKKKPVYIYVPNIKYEFNVDGAIYRGSRITFGDYSSDSKKRARKIVNKYPQGSKITIFYNPNNPNMSVILKKTGMANNLMLILGIGFILSGILLLFILIKNIILGR